LRQHNVNGAVSARTLVKIMPSTSDSGSALRTTLFSSPLGDSLILHSMTGTERLGRLYEYTVELLSKDGEIVFDDIVGETATVVLTAFDDESRYFNGYVTEFSYLGFEGSHFRYRATLRPWLWFLSQTADCRIFQEMTVPDIIEEVFGDLGFSDYELDLTGDYREWEYNVQYRETAFNFVSRLMEQEGIYYFFRHEEELHTLVLVDNPGAHETFPGYETVEFHERSSGVLQEHDYIYSWMASHRVQPGSCEITAYDFTKPRTPLHARQTASVTQMKPSSGDEIFDYPGEHFETSEGQTYAEQRMMEFDAQVERVRGSGNARGLCAGYKFTLDKYDRADQEIEYLVIAVSHDLKADSHESSGSFSDDEAYACSFEAINAEANYRSERLTPKPMVQGPQTAVVVGPSGDEIYTDEYGRIKCQFHWDRYGDYDENSSCWMRISVPAGCGSRMTGRVSNGARSRYRGSTRR
jgi:type VI secretion system secreted protein VgrG